MDFFEVRGDACRLRTLLRLATWNDPIILDHRRRVIAGFPVALLVALLARLPPAGLFQSAVFCRLKWTELDAPARKSMTGCRKSGAMDGWNCRVRREVTANADEVRRVPVGGGVWRLA